MFDGIGHKIGMFVHAISIVLAGFVLAFVYGWKLTLVLISVTPLLVVAGGILGKVTSFLLCNEIKHNLTDIITLIKMCS